METLGTIIFKNHILRCCLEIFKSFNVVNVIGLAVGGVPLWLAWQQGLWQPFEDIRNWISSLVVIATSLRTPRQAPNNWGYTLPSSHLHSLQVHSIPRHPFCLSIGLVRCFLSSTRQLPPFSFFHPFSLVYCLSVFCIFLLFSVSISSFLFAISFSLSLSHSLSFPSYVCWFLS